jgi:hypothetical protein
MDVARNIILGLLFVSLGFAAFASNAGLDPLVRFVSVVAVGITASVGSAVFFMSAFRRR